MEADFIDWLEPEAHFTTILESLFTVSEFEEIMLTFWKTHEWRPLEDEINWIGMSFRLHSSSTRSVFRARIIRPMKSGQKDCPLKCHLLYLRILSSRIFHPILSLIPRWICSSCALSSSTRSNYKASRSSPPAHLQVAHSNMNHSSSPFSSSFTPLPCIITRALELQHLESGKMKVKGRVISSSPSFLCSLISFSSM